VNSGLTEFRIDEARERRYIGGRDLLLVVVASAIWGASVPISKMGTLQFPPLFFLGLRFAVVTVLFAPFIAFPTARVRKRFGLWVLLGLIHFFAFILGLPLVDASTAVVTYQLQTPVGILIAAIVFRERLSIPLVVGVGLSFVGVLVIEGQPQSTASIAGVTSILVSALFLALGNIQMKSMVDVSPLAANVWFAAFATPLTFSASFLIEHDQFASLLAADLRGFASVVYVALISTLVAYSIWYHMLRLYPARLVMPFTLLIPTFGVGFAVLLLVETLSLRFLVGTSLTIAGIYLAIRPDAQVTREDRCLK
jgi:O-acetylserine/cysteine efflux transporter